MSRPSLRLLVFRTLGVSAFAFLAVAATTAQGQDTPGEPTVQVVIPVDLTCRTDPRPRDELFDQMTAALASTATPTMSTGGLTLVEDPLGSYDFDVTVDSVLWIEDNEPGPSPSSDDVTPVCLEGPLAILLSRWRPRVAPDRHGALQADIEAIYERLRDGGTVRMPVQVVVAPGAA